MKLQGRNLEFNLLGDDVRLLQDELVLLGFSITDREGFFGETTLRAVREFQNRNRIDPITGVVDARTARTINAALNAQPRDTYRVRGRLLRADGEPELNARVRAFERRLRREERLGDAPVDGRGHFDIVYPVPQIAHLTLIVRAFDASGNELVASPIICPARPVETIDLIVGGVLRGPSEFRLIDERIAPVLEAEQVAPSELEPEDLGLLACRHELNQDHLRHYVDSRQIAGQTRLPASALYGLFRQNVPARLPAILQERTDVLRSILERAIEENQIPADGLDRFFRRLREISVEQSFSRPEAPGSSSLSELLSTARISRGEQEEILGRYLERDGNVEDFWARLRASGTVPERTIDQVQLTLQLGALTKNHVPLVRALIRRHNPASTRDLVRLDRQAWLDLIRGSDRAGVPPGIPGASDAEREETYAVVMTATVEEAFPTPFLAARLADGSDSEFPGQAEVVEFLNRNPDFAFENNRVDRYLEERGEAALEGIFDVETLRTNLRAIGRLAPIAGPVRRHEVIQPLLRGGFTSALAIERTGEPSFPASEIHWENRARKRSSAPLASRWRSHTPSSPSSVPPCTKPCRRRLLPRVSCGPNCCRNCRIFPTGEHFSARSIFVPASIAPRFMVQPPIWSTCSPSSGTKDALQSLTASGRRPDLVEIELTCRNTETTLPVHRYRQRDPRPRRLPLPAALPDKPPRAPRNCAPNPNITIRPRMPSSSAAVYPWNLPFSRSAEEARAYLSHLGIPRHRLMEDFRPEGERFRADRRWISRPTSLALRLSSAG